MKKTKLLALIIAVVMLCGAIVALAACGPKEYHVTYYYGDIKVGEETVKKGETPSGKVPGYNLIGGLYSDAELTTPYDITVPLTGKDAEISLYGEFTLSESWVNDTKNYTWRAGPSDLPTNWNVHTYQANQATYILDHTSDALYTFDYNDAGTAYEIVPSMASDYPTDVTSKYVGSYGISEGDTGKAYRIPLKSTLKFDDGTGINANTFVRSVQNLLDPNAGNFRADNLWKSGNVKIYGSQAYAMQGQTVDIDNGEQGLKITDLVKGSDNVYTNADGDIIYIALDTGMSWLGGNTLADYVGAYGSSYFDVEAYDALRAMADEKGNVPLTDESLALLTTVISVPAWGEGPGYEGNYWVYSHTYPEMEYAGNVGFFADGTDAIVIVLQNAMEDNFYLRYELCSSFFLVNNALYESCISTEGGVYTNDYGTSVATYSGFGPYKLVSFTAGNSFKLERNEHWHGYYEIELQGQYQTTAIQYTVVKNDEQRLQMFLRGELDSYGLRAEDMDEYYSSKYTYFDDSESTWFVAMNPDEATYEANQATATPKTPGNTVIKTVLAIKEFRQAMSYSLDRQDFIVNLNPTSSIAKALLSSMMVSDPDSGEMYRDTIQAQDAILEFWGLSDAWGEGKEYDSRQEAIESITGYDPAGAKTLFTRAFEIAKEKGYISADLIASGKWEVQIMIGMPSLSNNFYVNGATTLERNWVEAVKDTPFENHLVFARSEELGDAFGDALKQGRVDLLFGVGFSGSMFDPYSFMDVFSGSLAYDSFTDKESVYVDIEVDGTTVRASLYSWISECLQGNDITTNVVGADGDLTGETKVVNGGVDADPALRLEIMSKCEVAVLELCNMMPLMTDASASLRCMRINYKTENYILGLGRGGIQYYTYSYSDEEFAQFVQEQGGTLNYAVTE